MAFTFRKRLFAISLICMLIFCCYVGKAGEDVPRTGPGPSDPVQIVAKALLCFNDKYIYSSCAESYRLTMSGNLDIPSECTDEFCTGPCLNETYLVLKCIEFIMTNFEFYNKATIQDIRDTVQAGCGYGSERGKFNVTGHREPEESSTNKATIRVLVSLGLMFIGSILFF